MPNRILVLDDDRRVVDLICLILEREGFEVEGVTRYEEALTALMREKALLLISDLNMPEVGGIEGIHALRERGLIEKAIVVSGFVDADVQTTIEDTPGIVGWLEKPFDIKELAALVRRGLSNAPNGESLGEIQ